MKNNAYTSPDATSKLSKEMRASPRAGAYFPRRFITDFFRFIGDNKSDISIITYDDLPWGDDWDFENRYPEEREAWAAQLASGERDPNKAYVLLQYDVDSFPERSMDLLREPLHLLCPSNVMIFNKRIDRARLKSKRELVCTDYDLDDEMMRSLCKKGFVVGYHMNAYEQGLFDTDLALEIFDRDVRQLSERFPIKFFSAHGGVPDPDGRNNRDMPFHPDWQRKLRWIHNGYTPLFDGNFSDGGHNSPKLDPAGRDLRDFVSRFKGGKRYRILLHPQYYSNDPLASARYSGTPWYDEIMQQSPSPTESFWKDVKLTGPEPVKPKRRFFGFLVAGDKRSGERWRLNFKRDQ